MINHISKTIKFNIMVNESSKLSEEIQTIYNEPTFNKELRKYIPYRIADMIEVLDEISNIVFAFQKENYDNEEINEKIDEIIRELSNKMRDLYFDMVIKKRKINDIINEVID